MTFVAVLTVSAVLAHVLAGGMAPSALVTGCCAGALLPVGWALAGRDRPAYAVAGVALLGQVALHVTFCLTMPGQTTVLSMLCGHPTQPAAPGLMPMRVVHPGAMATSHQMLLMMLAAHSVGGVVVLLGLRSVEALAAALAGVLTAVLLWSRPAITVPTGRRLRLTGPVLCVRTRALFVVSPRRGPPVSVCS